MVVQTKICGLSTPETLDAALKGGASHVGFVFFAKSLRHVTLEAVSALAARVEGRAKIVGLFVDPAPDDIDRVRAHARLDVIQLHGDEHPALVSRLAMTNGLETWKAVPVRTAEDLKAAHKYRGSAHRILYDAKPLLRGHSHPLPWALSGGLDANNVAEAVRITGAPLLDVSSGVESASGVKDIAKITAFLKAASHL
jgi:phosphoribosylanthranilate isomerase